MSEPELTGSGLTAANSDAYDGFGSADANIWRLATALSAAAGPADVAAALADCGAPAAGAAFANMAVFDNRSNRVHVAHAPSLDREIAARWSEFAIDEPTPLCEAILSGQHVLLSNLEAIGARFPLLLGDTLAADLAATASLPLRSREGLTLGAVGFGWRYPQAFTTGQMSRLNLIAQLAADAIAQARGAPPAGGGAEAAKARVLQEAFLPAVLPRSEHLDVAAAYLPASDAPMGGDWYDAFLVDGGTCFVIGDVAGHGVRSVAAMAQLRNAVRAFADEDPSPRRVVTRVNRMLCRQDPDVTATMIVALWDPEHRTLVRTNAGHPPVLRCRAGATEFLQSEHKGVILGAVSTWEYGEDTKVLRPDTTLLLYTDGLIEARGESFEVSMERLRAYAEARTDLSPQTLCDDTLTWRLTQRSRNDDICVLAVRVA